MWVLPEPPLCTVPLSQGTTNYGITWNYETPPDVASLQNPNVKTLVLVPTSH